MDARHFNNLFIFLAEKLDIGAGGITFVSNIAGWCKEHGISEADAHRPFRLIQNNGGCSMLIKDDIPEEVVERRIEAVRIRDQVTNVAYQKADLLKTRNEKLAFLFLNEYARSLPDAPDDLLADQWAFDQMEKLGCFGE